MSLSNHDWVQQIHGTVICRRCGVFGNGMAPLFCYFPAADPTDIKSRVDHLTEARDEVEKLTKERDGARAEVERLNASIENLDALYVSRTNELREAERDCDAARAEVARLQEEVRTAWAQKADADASVNRYKRELADIPKHIRTTVRQIVETETERDTLKSELARVLDVEREQSLILAQMSETPCEKRVSDLEFENARLRMEVDRLNDVVVAFQKELERNERVRKEVKALSTPCLPVDHDADARWAGQKKQTAPLRIKVDPDFPYLTVAEFIERLSKFDANMSVQISDGYKFNFHNRLKQASFEHHREGAELWLDIGIGGCDTQETE